MSPREAIVRQARLALAAYGRGDMAAYSRHQTNARRLADDLERVEPEIPPARQLQPLPTDFEIEGPFVRKVTAATSVLFYALGLLLAAGVLASIFFTLGALLRAKGIL